MGGLAFKTLLGWAAAKIYAHYAQAAVDEQFDRILPKIENDIQSRKEDALKFLAMGRQAFAVTVIEIWTNSDFVTNQGTTYPMVEYHGLEISDTKKESHTSDRKLYFGNYNDTDIYTTSTSIILDKNIIDMYRYYLKQITWYQDQINAANGVAERQQLNRDLMLMMGDMKKILEQ